MIPSRDPEVRARIAEAALTHRDRIFTSVLRAGAPYSNAQIEPESISRTRDSPARTMAKRAEIGPIIS